MIRLFFIKNKLKNRKLINNNDDEIVKKYKDIAKLKKEEVLEKFNSNEETGLATKTANKTLEQDGENIVVKDEKHSWFYFFVNSFKDKFILILVILAIINKFVGDDQSWYNHNFGNGLASAMIRFFQVIQHINLIKN